MVTDAARRDPRNAKGIEGIEPRPPVIRSNTLSANSST